MSKAEAQAVIAGSKPIPANVTVETVLTIAGYLK
jgi:hypothetical protein